MPDESARKPMAMVNHASEASSVLRPKKARKIPSPIWTKTLEPLDQAEIKKVMIVIKITPVSTKTSMAAKAFTSL